MKQGALGPAMMGMVRIGAWVAQVDERVLELAASRCAVDRFRVAVEPGKKPDLELWWTEADADPGAGVPLNGVQSSAGWYSLTGDRLSVHIPPEPFAAEACLRALFQVGTFRQGGLLLHAASISFDGLGIVVTGPSGAGKSTWARLSSRAGGELLSDETVGLAPDGRVYGSPFRSDDDLMGQPGCARLKAILLLEKGDDERLAPVPPGEGIPALLQEVYRPAPGEIAASELLQRAVAITSRVTLRRLTFRNHPAVGDFMSKWAKRLA